ncbi:unnamed protein product [Clavelina lepadiformis]|uniref:Uncharacterized protein n=1 Tax=Clavelina lepadiformis TaxID=159417 RepID=A0ABP0FP34_CLALP
MGQLKRVYRQLTQTKRETFFSVLACVAGSVASIILFVAIVSWTQYDASYVTTYGISNQNIHNEILGVAIIFSCFFTICLFAITLPCKDDLADRTFVHLLVGLFGLIAGVLAFAGAAVFLVTNQEPYAQLRRTFGFSIYLAWISGGFNICNGICFWVIAYLSMVKRKVENLDALANAPGTPFGEQNEAIVLTNNDAVTEMENRKTRPEEDIKFKEEIEINKKNLSVTTKNEEVEVLSIQEEETDINLPGNITEKQPDGKMESTVENVKSKDNSIEAEPTIPKLKDKGNVINGQAWDKDENGQTVPKEEDTEAAKTKNTSDIIVTPAADKAKENISQVIKNVRDGDEAHKSVADEDTRGASSETTVDSDVRKRPKTTPGKADKKSRQEQRPKSTTPKYGDPKARVIAFQKK